MQLKCCAQTTRAFALRLLLGLIFLMGCTSASAATLSFNFSLPSGATTSAGAYKPDGTLVKTLWRKVYYAAGTHNYTWNGTDDFGASVPAGNYQFKIVAHNIQYVWEGAIGNTSQALAGPTVHRAFYPMHDMSIAGTNAFYVTGFNESLFPFARFNTGTPQVVTKNWRWIYNTKVSRVENWPANSYDRAWGFTATDGTRVYFACPVGTNPVTRAEDYAGFITASNVSDSSLYSFSSGGQIPQGPADQMPLANGIYAGTQPGLSGLAVQATGSLLAAAVKPDNKVYFFNKTTGAASGSLTVTAPKRIEFAPNGDLWVCSGTTVARYTLTVSTSVWALVTTITGFSNSLDVAVHPSDNNIVMVADGGTSQQVKAYNSTGTSLWTYGTAGGYTTNGGTVTNSKFWFTNDTIEDTFIAIHPDGSFWVGDGGNRRNLHFSSGRAYLDQIAFVPHTYVSCVDRNNTNRVFNGFLEFSVDYSQPIGTSWTLVKNWGAGLSSSYAGRGLRQVVTLSNGRTYGTAKDMVQEKEMLVELVSNNLRIIGPIDQFASGHTTISPNGDLVKLTHNTPSWTRRVLTGFDVNNDPQWAAGSIIATASNGSTDPSPRCCGTGDIRAPITSSNVIVSYDQSKNNGFHLGGVSVGGSAWLWKAMPAVTSNIPLDGLGSYSIGDGITYAGNTAMTAGRHIVAGFHGEFWNQKQAGQFMHFWDNGLFLGQFGEPSVEHTAFEGAIAGFAGNGVSPELVRTPNGEYYLWTNDEWGHGPQRWHLVGANSIRELSGSGTLGGSTVTVTATAVNFPTNLIATPGNAEVGLTWAAVPGASSYNVKYSATNGGPYTSVTGVTSTSYVKTGLTNSTQYYFVVSAIVGGVESANSDQATARPFNPTIIVQAAGQQSSTQRLFKVTSAAPAAGVAALKGLSILDNDLTLYDIGNKGYRLFNWSGPGVDNSNVLSPFTVTKGGGWVSDVHLQGDFRVDGVSGTDGGLYSNTVGTIDIAVSDTNFHVLTVFSSVRFADARAFTVTLKPQGLTTPAVTYTVAPEDPGRSHTYQFLFKGNVTLTVDSTGGAIGTVQAIFLDNLNVLSTPTVPSGLTATADQGKIRLAWPAVSGAASYNVYSGTTSGGQSTTPIATGVTGTTYINTGLANGTAYYYKIKAVNGSGTSGYSNEANATPAPPSILRATSAPTIDGTVDTMWNSAVAYNVSSVVHGATMASGSWKAMWDNSKLYVLATVMDSSLLNATANYNGDSVELYIDADNSKNTTYGANDFQYILGWGDVSISEYAHGGTTGVTYAQTNITGGYRMEFAIPWSTLGVTPAASNLIGFDLGIDDAATVSSRVGQVMWNGTSANFQNPSLFGVGKLMP